MRFYLVIAAFPWLSAGLGCSQEPVDHTPLASFIPCGETADCVARGGECVDNYCRADNECTTNADCAEGTCVADEDFGGLCGSETSGPPVPLPAWPCVKGADCPIGQGCGSDGLCHEDGECYAGADCPAGEICYNAGNDDPAGFCAAERPPTNPYCRSDGAGACRYECDLDGTCGGGGTATCIDALCHYDDECVTVDDCSPNHVCEPWDEYGFSTCVEDPEPTCVDDGTGVCRIVCETSVDCVLGGGCEADGFCHASNECTTADDCAEGELCYEAEHFGGLCGAERP